MSIVLRQRFGIFLRSLARGTPTDKLLLDISIYSPSDLEYQFQELTLKPDIPHTCDLHQCLYGILSTMFDSKYKYMYLDGEESKLYPDIKGSFGVIGLEECLLGNRASESQW